VTFSLSRRIAAEALGTFFLLATVVGSGIMAERLFPESDGLALMANTAATGAALAVLILTFGSISGAHFNPAVSLSAAYGRVLPAGDLGAYVLAQLGGAVAGVVAANLMFDLAAVSVSQHARNGAGQLLSEFVATFGLLSVNLGCSRFRSPATVAGAVAAYISAAYWFTASTSFANPAVTIARSLSDTFAGIAPGDVAGFVSAQLLGAAAATLTFHWMAPIAQLADVRSAVIARAEP
jgi:glycerol uptake facilitator-like aquaporin